jgi:2-oxo-3-(phosphooxy)propyl 3-oxoalkanoate synthase
LGTSDTPSQVALRWDQTVDRRMVHRNSVAEVLLTDLVRLSDSSFEVAAQWPRSHRVYRPNETGRHDPMLILESIRQTGLALSHFGFAVTFEQRSIMCDLGFELDARLEPRALLSATDVTIRVDCDNVIIRRSALRGMTVRLSFAADGIRFATGVGTIRWIPADTYLALRARSGSRLDLDQRWSTPPRLRPTANREAADALLVPASGDLELRRLVLPLSHPVYFDHPLDHAPGMLLIDAAWQAVLELRGKDLRLVSCSMQCPTFTELGIETDVRLLTSSEDTIGFLIEQHGKVTATGTLTADALSCRLCPGAAVSSTLP